MNAGSLMIKNPKACLESSSLEECAQLMLCTGRAEIPVVKDRESMHTLGIITDSDIIFRTISLGKELKTMKVADCYSKLRFTAKENSSFDDCLKIMERHSVRCLPVVDDNGKCVGVVSKTDITSRV